jgi:hypothetical protein
LIDFGGPGSGHASEFPAAAGSTNVGGQGAHWTCACPRPRGEERIPFIPTDELDSLLDQAEELLHVNHDAFSASPVGAAIRSALRAELAADLPVDAGPGFLPVAGDEQADGTMIWAGTEVILGPILDSPELAGRFELRPLTQARQLLHSDGHVTSVLLKDQRTGRRYEEAADVVVVAADALRSPQLLWASGVRPPALGHYLTEHPAVFSVIALDAARMLRYASEDDLAREKAQRALNPSDPISGVNRVPYSEPDHPFGAQVMFNEVTPFNLPEGDPLKDNPWGYVNAGYGLRKFPRYEDSVTFGDDEVDYLGMPCMTIHYQLTERELAEVELAKGYLGRIRDALGTFVSGGEPRLMPAGTSLHYSGTMRMGEVDDGASVCDSWSRLWGYDNLIVGGNALIPTATAANPTLTSVALAIRGADWLARDLNSGTDKTGSAPRSKGPTSVDADPTSA